MEECIRHEDTVPQWYIAVTDDKIIGGVGIIENDFHDRKDLSPNVCDLYVEEDYRCQGIAGEEKPAVVRFKAEGIIPPYIRIDEPV